MYNRLAILKTRVKTESQSHIEAPPSAKTDRWKINKAVFMEGQNRHLRRDIPLSSIDTKELRSSCMNEQPSLMIKISWRWDSVDNVTKSPLSRDESRWRQCWENHHFPESKVRTIEKHKSEDSGDGKQNPGSESSSSEISKTDKKNMIRERSLSLKIREKPAMKCI